MDKSKILFTCEEEGSNLTIVKITIMMNYHSIILFLAYLQVIYVIEKVVLTSRCFR